MIYSVCITATVPPALGLKEYFCFLFLEQMEIYVRFSNNTHTKNNNFKGEENTE